MAIRLTESRLRQIIHEEAAKLSRPPTRNLREGKFSYSTKLSYLHEALDALEQAQVHEQSSAIGNDPDLDDIVAGLQGLIEGVMAASGHRMAGPGQQLPPVPGRLPEGRTSAKLVPSVRAMSSAKRVLRKFGVPLDDTGLDRVFNVVLDYGPFKDAAAFKSQLKQSLDTDTLSDLRGEGRSTDEFFAAFLGAFQTDRLPEGRSLVEAYRRGRGGGGVTRRSSNEDDQIAHIMRERGVNYERAEQILTDIYDDVGHDDGLVADAVYGHPMDYDED